MPQLSKREIASKKRQAVHLFLVKGYQQKEIARILCVSEKTICLWAKKHKWNDRYSKDVNIEGGLFALMNRFLLYAESIKPEAVDSFKILWVSFLKNEEKSFHN